MNNPILAVCLRIYPGISRKPFLKKLNKFELVKISLKSLKGSLTGVNAKFIFILDGCPEEYRRWILTEWNGLQVEINETAAVGNAATFKLQHQILLKQNTPYVYFGEDDYIYTKDCFQKALSIFESISGLHFFSPYFIPDYHSVYFHNRNLKLIDAQTNQDLYSVKSTTCSFLARTTAIRSKEFSSAVELYPRINDIGMWLLLTKLSFVDVATFFSLFKVTGAKWVTKYFFLKMVWLLPRMLTGKKFVLGAYLPALATHMEEDFLAPGRNWTDIASELS